MTTPNDDPDITTLMAETTAQAIVQAIDSISEFDPFDDRVHRQRARELAIRNLTRQFSSVLTTLHYTHEHFPKETNARDSLDD